MGGLIIAINRARSWWVRTAISGVHGDQDDRSNARDGLPVLSRPEGFGALFGQQERKNSQSELVIFLRPVVVSDPSLESSELSQFQHLLPSARSVQ